MSRIKGIQLVFILLLGVDNTLQDRVDLYKRPGDTVSLPSNVLPGHPGCGSTTWIYVGKANQAVTVANLGGKISHSELLHQSKASRMSWGSNCSLTVKNVTAEDAGSYNCQQWINNTQIGDNKYINLFVLDITRGNSGTEQTLTCSLFGPDMNCEYNTLRWMNEDGTLITDYSQSPGCSITLTSSQHDLTNKFTCQVALHGDVKLTIVFPGDAKTPTQPSKPPPDAPTGTPPKATMTASTPQQTVIVVIVAVGVVVAMATALVIFFLVKRKNTPAHDVIPLTSTNQSTAAEASQPGPSPNQNDP